MKFIILDLEWNSAFSKKTRSYINEIIEFGAVKCDENLNIIDTFSSFVRYQVGKKINSVVSQLTSIKHENLCEAGTYMNVVGKFKRWAGEDTVILTWGTSDILTLIENCRYFSGSEKISFLYKYADLQRYCESLIRSDSKDQLGLSAAAQILSVDTTEIEQHRALDDSLLTLAIMKRLYPQNSIDFFIQDATDDEFYRKITFKTSIISDIAHPLITKKSLLFTCEKCEGEARRLSKWQFKNKRFVADFRCPNCMHEFSGRIQLKEKYEGLTVNKKVVPIPKIQKPRVTGDCKVNNMNLKVHENGVALLTFDEWSGIDQITHAFSTRIGGVSKCRYASMNLGFAVGDEVKSVHKNFDLISKALGVKKSNMVTGNQDHNCNILKVTHEEKGKGVTRIKFKESIDGLCTDQIGVMLMVYCSDCVPIYFYDSEKKCIGLAHAGWKGTVNGMASAMVEKLVQEFSSNPKDLKVAIGPCISYENFEVDLPCAQEFMNLPNYHLFVKPKGEVKYLVDLPECNRQFLIKSGVLAENISLSNVCTVENSDLVFSHRVTKGQRGSNAAFLALK